MKNKCTKCGEELSSIYDFGLCYNCRRKEDKKMMFIMIGIVVFVLIVILGVKLIWAKIVYNDYRCVFSECRLLKN